MGVPTVTLVTRPFERAARTAARGHGLAELPIVVLADEFAEEPDAVVVEDVLRGLAASDAKRRAQ